MSLNGQRSIPPPPPMMPLSLVLRSHHGGFRNIGDSQDSDEDRPPADIAVAVIATLLATQPSLSAGKTSSHHHPATPGISNLVTIGSFILTAMKKRRHRKKRQTRPSHGIKESGKALNWPVEGSNSWVGGEENMPSPQRPQTARNHPHRYQGSGKWRHLGHMHNITIST